ncbi:MAG: glycosyltransferase family 39 protein [Bacteroidota bacterium]
MPADVYTTFSGILYFCNYPSQKTFTLNLLKSQISPKTEYFFLFLSLIFLALNSNYTFNIYDEGVAVTGAMRILHGEIPYRDFWTMYAPGQYYFLAVLFKIFGQSLLIERIFSVLILWGIAVISWKIAKIFLSKNAALAILLLETLWISSYRFYGSPLATALLLAMMAVYYTILFLKTHNVKYIFLAGIFAGITMIFRHDLGAYIIIALSVVISAHYFHRFKSDVFKEVFKSFLLFLLGIFIITIPVAAYFLSRIPLKTLTDQLITFPATTFADYRALPFPSIFTLFKSHSVKEIVKTSIELCMFYLPITALFIMLVMFLKRIFRKNPDIVSPRFSEITVVWAVSVIFMMQVSVRADGSHLLAPMVPVIIICVYLLQNRNFLLRFKSPIFIFILLIGFGAFSGAIFSKAMVLKKQFTEEKFVVKNEKAVGISGDGFLKEYDNVLRFLKENTVENEKVFVGNMRHDKLVNNDAMLYFLSDRLPAIRYHELHPGAATSENVQGEIISDLLKNNIKTVVLREEILTVIEPNKSSVSSSVFLLDNFFKNNFSEVAKFGDYTVLKRVEH